MNLKTYHFDLLEYVRISRGVQMKRNGEPKFRLTSPTVPVKILPDAIPVQWIRVVVGNLVLRKLGCTLLATLSGRGVLTIVDW